MSVLQIKQALVMGDWDQLLLHGRNLPFPSPLQTFLPFNSQTLKEGFRWETPQILDLHLSASCPCSSYQELFLFSFEGQFHLLCGPHSFTSSHRLFSGLALISFIHNPALSSEFLSPPFRWSFPAFGDKFTCYTSSKWSHVISWMPPPPACGMEFVTLLPIAHGMVVW